MLNIDSFLERARAVVAQQSGDDEPSDCPTCGDTDWVRDGFAQRRRGEPVQVYRCRACGKKRVGRSDSPFRHPLFAPETMVCAVLMRREGFTLKEIAEALVTTDDNGAPRGPNRQTVARWLKRFGPLVDESAAAEPVGGPEPGPVPEPEPESAPEAVRVTPAISTPEPILPEPILPEPIPPDRAVDDPRSEGLIAGRFELQKTLSGNQDEGVHVVIDHWLADDAPPRALKILKAHSGDLEHEFALRSRLHHPNVAGVRDFGTLDAERHWFTQDFVRGKDLYDAGQGVAFERVLEWMVGVLRGCAYFHGRAILHRDLKPDNILVGEDSVPRVVDFGISIERDRLRPGGPSGSLGYLAPEMLEGAAPGPTVDLYAVAMTFYHVLARELPEPPRPLPSLAARRPDVPAWFDELLVRMTSLSRLRRLPNAAAVIDEIVKRSGIRFLRETRGTLVARIEGVSLLGRDVELDRIDESIENEGSVLVTGPAGIGKTRLISAWRRRCQLAGGQVIEGPLPTLLKAVTTRLGTGHPLVRQHADVLERLTGGEARDMPLPLSLRDGLLRDREAILQLIGSGLGAESVLLVDNVDSTDEATFAVLEAIVAMGRGPRLVLGARSGSGERDAALKRWMTQGALVAIELGPLSDASVRAIIEDAFDQSPIAADLAPRIARAAEGNPRFIEEVLRGLVEREAVRQGDDGEWRADADELPVPSQLADACQTRVAALDEAERTLLRTLAAAGADVPRAAVEQLADDASLARLLDRALCLESVHGVGVAHEGVTRAALKGVTPDELRALQVRVCDGVEAQVVPAARPVELMARLLHAAGEAERAIPYLAMAADRASERWEVEEARAWLQLLDELLTRPGVSAPEGLRQSTLRSLVRMLRFAGRWEELSVCMDRLSLLAQMDSDTGLLHEAAALKALFWFDRGRPDLARQIVQGHLGGARDLGHRPALARFLWVLAMVERHEGNVERGLELSDEVLELLGDSSEPEALELRVQNHINRGNAFGQSGRLDRAVSALERALALCRQHGLASSAIVATMNLGICHAMQCRYGPALDHFDRARQEAERLGWPEMSAFLQANQAEVERHLGLWTCAAGRAERMLQRTDDKVAPNAVQSARCTLAMCRCELGDQRGAAAVLEEARRAATQPGPSLLLAEAVVGFAAGSTEAMDRAANALEQMVDGVGAPHHRALAGAWLARMALEDGVQDRALELVAQAEAVLAAGPREVREGRVDLLYVTARIHLARGDAELAERAVSKAVDEVGRQCVELDEPLRAAFLATPLHRELAEDAQRLLNRTPGFAAGQAKAGPGAQLQDVHDILQITRKLSRAQGLAAVIHVVLDAFLRHTRLDRALLLTREEARFVALGARRAGRTPLDPNTIQADSGVLDAMIRVRRPVTEHDAGGTSSRRRSETGTFNQLAVPLCYGVSVIGVVWMEVDASAQPIAPHRRLLLESLADQAAMAIKHHLQLDEIERLRRRAQADLTRTRARLAEEASRREQAERAAEAERRNVQLRYSYHQIIHCSQAMKELLAQVDRLVERKITVLVNGESGTGKELIARALHHNGPRRAGPFVAINCGAIPSNLIESELFGHVRGAFTGAVKERRGHFELAHRGTLLLDEIGEIAPDVQVRLLRVLETGEVTPVGSSRRVKVDVRIVAATNRDLPTEVASGRFREDLYYRINAITLRLPPLRERPEDIPLLIEHFATVFGKDRGESAVIIHPDVMRKFTRHTWPGNVRELRNVVEYATLFADNGVVPADLALPF